MPVAAAVEVGAAGVAATRGTTPLAPPVAAGARVTVSAPLRMGQWRLSYWTVNGAAQPGRPSIEVSAREDLEIGAHYVR